MSCVAECGGNASPSREECHICLLIVVVPALFGDSLREQSPDVHAQVSASMPSSRPTWRRVSIVHSLPSCKSLCSEERELKKTISPT